MTTETRPLLTVTVPGHPPGPNARLHWTQRYMAVNRLFNDAAWQAKGAYKGGPLRRAHVHIRLVHRTKHRYDPDNAVAVCKPLIDALIVADVLLDDGPEYITLDVTQETGGKRGCIIEVWPREEA